MSHAEGLVSLAAPQHVSRWNNGGEYAWRLLAITIRVKG